MITELTGKIIELGGGSNPQFHPNLDIRKAPGVDIVASLEEPLPVESESYDGVYCQYAVEHISWRKVKDFLKEVHRILKPEGKAVFITANLKEQAKVIASREKWEGDYESRLIFGDQNYPENTHRCGLSPEYAQRLFNEIGFQVNITPLPQCPTDMIITAIKPPLDRVNWVKNKIDELLKDRPEAQIVDIGCFDCPITWFMTNCTWVDTDSYERIVQSMKTFNRQPIPREKFVQAIADDLPFDNKQFEVALLTEILEHVDDPVKVLKEVKRVAKHVIITCPDEYSWDLKWKPFQNPGHIRHYTERMLKEHLKQAKINHYTLGQLAYQGWAFFTTVADLGEVSTVKKRETMKSIFDRPDYWCGEIGYRPGSDGIGYRDFPIHQVKADYIIAKGPGKVLDVGCAMGFLVNRLRRRGIEAWGIDISQYALSRAPEEVKPYLVHGSADTLPWPDQFFDMAVTFGTLEHLSPKKAIAEIKRVAKRGIISVGLGDDPHFDEDVTHQTKRPLSWWQSQFPPEFEVRDDANEEWLGGEHFFLKIALLSTPFMTVPPRNYGGLERIVYDLAYVLAKVGHQVTVFAPDGSYVEGCEMACFGPALEKVQVNWLEAEKKAVSMVAGSIMNDGYSIIHGHNWFGLEYALKAQKPELKTCHTHHGGLNMDYWGGSKPPWPLNLISISNWMQRVYASQGFNSRPIYNGIPVEDYGFKAEKGDRLLFVGRIDSFKRPHIAIEVAKKVGLGLDILGGSFVYDTAYLDSIKQACDGQQIKLHLDAPQEEKIGLYQNARAVIFPSKMGEPFGLIVPEANACGTPVIASRDGAIPETIEDGVTGFICDSVDDMVKAVAKVDQIKPEACRERVERLFSREVMARNYVEAYRSILNGDEW